MKDHLQESGRAHLSITVIAIATIAALGAVAANVGFDDPTASTAGTEAAPIETSSDSTGELDFDLSDTDSHGSEITLDVTREGVIFVGGWDRIARSSDGGDSWDHSVPGVIGDTGPVEADSQLAADRVLEVDEDTDRVYVDDTTLACTVLRWSDDLGGNWTSNPIACGGGATDHQKIAIGDRTTLADPTGELYPNVVYVCANGLTHTPCAASNDGGRTFGPGVPSQQVDAETPSNSQTTCGFQGQPATGDDGTIYQPQTQCGAKLWYSTDNGLTWTQTPVPVTPSEDTADVAPAENSVYYAYTNDDWQPKLVPSLDGGESFVTPIAIGPSNLTSSLFTVATAEVDGRVGFAYYGTFDDPGGWDHNPGNAPDSVVWHLFAGVVTDADTDPTVHVERLTTENDPIQRGCLSKLGDCLGNIADYIDVDQADGKVHVGYVDGCDACDTADDSTDDDAYLAIQTDGPRLT